MTPKYHDSFEELEKWLEGFRKRHQGYFPQKMERWYQRVEKSHQEIRNLIGGIRVQKLFTLESNQDAVALEQIKPITNEILAIIPSYLAGYGFTEDVFCRPTIQQGTHSVFKVSKHVRTYAEKVLKNPYNSDDTKEKMKRLDKALSRLGEVWAKSKTSNIELEATLSTSAKSFILLGHYGPDSDSCFRNGSDKTNHKFVLGQTPNTFTLSVAQKHPKKDKFVNKARAFGFVSNNNKTLNFCNLYLSPGFMEGDVLNVVSRMSEEILGGKCKMQEDMNSIYGHGEINNGIYQNPYGKWSFTLGSKLNIVQQLIPERHLVQTFRCPRCAEPSKNENGWEDVDEEYLCKYCHSHAHICEITNKATFKDLVPVLNDCGFQVLAHPDYAAKLIKCSICELNSPSITEVENDMVCPSCLELVFDQCENCHRMVRSENISDIGDKTVCNSCVENGCNPFEEEFIMV